MRIKAIATIALASAVLLPFSSCKKLQDLLDSDLKQFNYDSNELKGFLDQTDQDINQALNDLPGFGKAEGFESSPLCGVIIDTSEMSQGIVYFNFDGTTPCFHPSSTRSGQVKVELLSGNNWQVAGAVIRETFINYRITRLSDNKFIQFNGVKTLKNVNGSNWVTFFLGMSPFRFQERAFNINVTFDGNMSAVWNSARDMEWSYVPANSTPGIQTPYFAFQSYSDTTIQGHSHVDSWGVNRYGQDFVTYYNAAYRSNSYCGFWRPVAGDLVHEVAGDELGLKLGVDQNGNASTANCAYGFEVRWTVDGQEQSQVFSY